jgi:hypothetical protein
MCDCSDFETPAVFEEVTRKARKCHRCGECKGLIERSDHYWESRGLWQGEWSTHKTCGSCYVVAHSLLDCYSLGDLVECIDNDLGVGDRDRGSDARIAYAGMRRRCRHAKRTLSREAAHEADQDRR